MHRSPCTCLRLRKAARRVSQIYDRHLEPYGLTITQYGLLSHLKTLDGIGVSALADLLVMDPTTLSRNLRPLEREGYVAISRDPKDRRNRQLHLTEMGRETQKRAYPGWAAAQAQIDETLGPEAGALLADTVDGMLEKLHG